MRLKSRDFLAAERRAGEAGYRLTEAGLHDLTTGDRRIFRPSDGHRRGRLGAGRLLGAGDRPAPAASNCAPSCPGSDSARSAPGCGSRRGRWPTPPGRCSTDAGLDGYVTWFAAQHLTEIDVAAWWDLDCAARPSTRPSSPAPPGGGRRRPQLTDEQAFAGYLRLIDDWRLFPRLDPGLPESLLPADWPARAAWELFDTLHDRWSAAGPAARARPSVDRLSDRRCCGRAVRRRTAPG